MVQKRRCRTINILFILAGLVSCMVSVVMPDRTGILGDSGVSLLQTMGSEQIIYQIMLPLVFALTAALLVVLDKAKVIALISALIASGMYAYMDWGYISARQSCPAILVNMAGIILLITGALLQCAATPDAAAIVREEHSERAEEETNQKLASSVYFDGESVLPAKDKEAEADEGLDISEALAAFEGSEETEETEESEETEEPEESEKPEKKKKKRKKKVAVSWNTDEELAELLKKEIKKQRTEWTEESQEDED